MDKYLLIDIGGTSIKVAEYEETLSSVEEVNTNAKEGVETLIQTIYKIVESHPGITHIGISTAGQVDPEKGCIIYANENMPGYTGTNWKELLENQFHVPVYVENDVNAAALGEGTYGVGKGVSNYLCLTYGTGVGGAIVFNHEIYHGSSHSAGEFGALITHKEKHQVGKPFSGSYETYASTSALVRKAIEKDPTLMNGRIIFSRIEEEEVRKIIDEWVEEIVIGLSSLIHIFNPEMVILGGGIMEQDYLFHKVKEVLYEDLMDSYKGVRIEKAKLGNQAGLYGMLGRIMKEIKA